MDGIKQWIEAEGSGHWFFVAFPVALICLLIWFKGRRVRFLIPSLIISIVIINPVFFKYWDELGLYAYWRILWVIPLIPVVAGLVPSITERIHKGWMKSIVVAAGVGAVALGGTFLYNGAGGSFVEAANAVKLPDYVVEVADRLMQLDEHPRVIAQSPIGIYIRQYTGNIDTLFGRDMVGYIYDSSADARMINAEIYNPESDLNAVSQFMLDEDYDYFIIQDRETTISGFEQVDQVGDYGIYKASGQPSVLKERNQLGQVMRETNVNENGQPINNGSGYATVLRNYDDRNNIIFEYHVNSNGEGILDKGGKAGFECTYDTNNHITWYRTIGVDKEPVTTYLGYAEYRREYQGQKLVRELFFDTAGKLVNCINGYAIEELEYDGSGNVVVQRFMDFNGHLVVSVSGYAEKKCRYNSRGQLVKEEYFDSEMMPCVQLAGYVAFEQEWVGDDLISRTYLDVDGLPKNRFDGYSKVLWTKDENGTKNVEFETVDGETLEIGDLNLAKDIEIGSDGWSAWMTPETGRENVCFYIGKANLGKKAEGDDITCSVDIEFKDVTPSEGKDFVFFAQGSTDGNWNSRNVWNGSLIWTNYAPQNGIYSYSCTETLDSNNAKVTDFAIGFRCDNWASGSFRVREIKIQKGNQPTNWTPGI